MRALFVFGLVFLSACTSLPPSGQKHQSQLKQLQAWQINASIAAKSSHHGWQARLLWRYQHPSYYLRVNAPLGQGAFSLRRDADGRVSLQTAEGDTLTAESAEQLLSEQLDLNLPLDALPYWIKGQIAPELNVSLQQVSAQGYLSLLEQGGWKIEFSRYRPETIAGKTYSLPHKIHLSQADYFAKIVITRISDHP